MKLADMTLCSIFFFLFACCICAVLGDLLPCNPLLCIVVLNIYPLYMLRFRFPHCNKQKPFLLTYECNIVMDSTP